MKCVKAILHLLGIDLPCSVAVYSVLSGFAQSIAQWVGLGSCQWASLQGEEVF